MIPYGRQHITDEDIEAVVEVLKSDFLTQGPYVEKFEKALADYCGVKYAVAVNSCTAALHIAYMGMGLGEGDLLWTVPNTFVATANAGLYCGADVDFVDIDPETYLMCPNKLKEKLEIAKEQERLPDIVAPVHFSGQSCKMEDIHALSGEYGFEIVEDAAHCIGASYNGKKVGACEFAKAAVLSFHPVKIVTTGEGGAIMTNDKALYEKLLMLRTHGITKNPEKLSNQAHESWYFEQHHLGYHYRITDMQCALGVSQMNRLDGYVEKRNHLVKTYKEKLKHLPVILPKLEEKAHSSWHLFVVQLDRAKIQTPRDKIFTQLREKGIGVNMHYIPVHTHPYYKELGFKAGQFPISEHYADNAITLPLYPGLTEDEQNYICRTLEEILNEQSQINTASTA